MVMLDFDETQKLLEKYNIPAPKGAIAKSKNEASKIAAKIGFPVVLKAISPEIIHKTEANAVVLELKDRKQVETAYTKLKKLPKAEVLVQKMHSGHDVIIGLKRDMHFGPVIAFGLGGIFVEVLKDIAFRVAPVSHHDAMEMVKEIKAYPVLAGFRKTKKANIKRLTEMLLNVSRLAMENPNIKELDLNPVIVDERKAVAVDARLIE